MQFIKFLLFPLVLIFGANNVISQDKVKSYNFKKGEVFDFLFLINKKDENAVSVRDGYFKTAIPIAIKSGYQPQPGYATPSSPSQGNYHPEAVVLGKWPSVQNRKETLVNLETQLDDFHGMRRDIWATFYATIYEIHEDLSFEVKPGKFNVITLYWASNEKAFEKFKNNWKRKTKSKGGIIWLDFGKGVSPAGYHFTPDSVTITEWNSKSEFDQFLKLNLKMDHNAVLHVNQIQIK